MKRSQIEQSIKAYFRPQRDVVAVYLFGSFANAEQRPDSDVDIAVLCHPDKTREEYFELELTYFVGLSRAVAKNLDIVILNCSGELLCYEVFRTGRVLFERDRDRRVSFQSQMLCRYFDLQPRLHQMTQGMVKKLREKGAHG